MRFRTLVSVMFTLLAVCACASTGQAAQATRKYGEVQAPTYGEVPAPKFGNVRAPTYGETEPPRSGDPAWPAETAPAPGERTPAPAAVPDAPATVPAPGAISARYYYMERGVLHTWDFAPNGTYLYTEVMKGAGFSRRTSERGTYRIAGNMLEVHPTRQTGATASGTTGGKTDTLTAGTDSRKETRRYRVKMLGPAGRDGMVLDGVPMKAKSW